MDENTVICIQGGGKTSKGSQGSGWNEDVCFTLNAVDVHGVAYERCESGAILVANDENINNAK